MSDTSEQHCENIIEERDFFLFRKEWCDAVRGLSSRLRLEIWDAIIEYGIYGKSASDLRWVASLTFRLAKAAIDRDNEELTRRKVQSSINVANGKKGGRPKTPGLTPGFSAEKSEKNANQSPCPSRACAIVVNNNKNISTDKKEDNQKKEKEAHKKEQEKQEKNLPQEQLLPLTSERGLTRKTAQEIMDYFNKQVVLSNSDIPKVVKMSDQRYSHIKQRFEDYGLESIYMAMDKMFKSDFLTGKKKSGSNWRATFDWLFLPTNFLKVIEGNYDNTKSSSNNGNYNSRQAIDPRRGTDATHVAVEEYEKGF